MGNIISKTPQCSNRIFTVRDVLDQLTAFDAMYEASGSGSVGATSNEELQKANWRKEIRENVINCGGRPTELDFFENVFGAPKAKPIQASEIFIKYNCDKDYNIISQNTVPGGGPGQSAQFTLLKSLHSGNGKYSNVVENGSVYNYTDDQWYRITDVDRSVDYAHVVTVSPYVDTTTVNIKAGKKMMFTPVRMKDGYSCAIPTSNWDSPGYLRSVRPVSFRKDWEMPLELNRAYQNIFQFAIIFDKDGNAKDSFIPYLQQDSREMMKLFKNLYQFTGTKMTNPDLVGATGIVLQTGKYSGFDGYIPTMKYGGGTVQQYDPAFGYSLEADFMSVILKNDAIKQCKEFTVIHGLNFMAGLVRANKEWLKDQPGQNNLASIVQTIGGDAMAIKKLKIKSYEYLGYGLHFREMDALTDSRLIGNGMFPDLAMMIPMQGVRDDKGNAVPAIEYWNPMGLNADGTHWESGVLDHRYQKDHCDKLSGSMTEELMMGIHCPHLHILLQPKVAC
jgi:hypothetical protein